MLHKKDKVNEEASLDQCEKQKTVEVIHGNPKQYTQFQKVGAAIFYGIASILVIFTNKAIMANFEFKYFDFLATVQFIMTTTIISLLILCKQIDSIPVLSFAIFKEVIPITLMFLGNVLCGLGSTKSLNIPMFTALRRFSICLTMLGEWYLLKTKPSWSVIVSIFFMVAGALIAALYDLSFDAEGYVLVFLNNIFTALNGVYMKKASNSGKCSKMSVLYYNSLFSTVIMLLYFMLEHSLINGYLVLPFLPTSLVGNHLTSSATTSLTGIPAIDALQGGSETHPMPLLYPAIASTLTKVLHYPHWADFTFLCMLFMAASMGAVLNYSIFLCTMINSPLTTAVVGATKNVATTYIAMVVFPDYAFTYINFLGINISILGSLYYTYMILFKGAVGFGGV